ncbi:MAG: GMP synthase-like glutamine amidotransferase [Planctomycetota bacterium]|jgi:GMP synthase-like glutamine amidotransferase
MSTLLIDNETTLLSELEKSLSGEVTIKSWSELEGVSLDDYDVVVLSGGSSFPIVGHEKDLSVEMELIRNAQIPVIGICFGAELIATAFGGTLDLMSEHHKGLVQVMVTKEHEVFRKKATFTPYENHGWRITALPEELEVLARSGHSMEIFHHRQRPLWGVQFHPEYVVADLQVRQIVSDIILYELSKI